MNQEREAGLDALIAAAATRAVTIERELAENLRDACAEKPVLADKLARLLIGQGESAIATLLGLLGDAHNEETTLRTKAAALVMERYLPHRQLVRHVRR